MYLLGEQGEPLSVEVALLKDLPFLSKQVEVFRHPYSWHSQLHANVRGHSRPAKPNKAYEIGLWVLWWPQHLSDPDICQKNPVLPKK
jgi:hypothetical protein